MDNSVAKEWIIPCNANSYKIREALTKLKILDWRQTKQLTNAKVGDIIYLYCKYNGKGAIWFKGAILKVNKTDNFIDDSEFSLETDSFYEGRCIEIAMFREYDVIDDLTYGKLKNAGLKSRLQGAVGISESVAKYLHEIDEKQRAIDRFDGTIPDTCLSDFPIKIYENIGNTNNNDDSIVIDEYIRGLSINKLKEIAQKKETMKPKNYISEVKQIERSPYIAEYAKRRANGICQLCNKPAPFNNPKTGEPYLESHHVVWLSQGGSDTIDNIVALCPNCHKKLHYVNDSKDVEKLKLIALREDNT